MRILVTGGAGYLGCHLVPRLLEHGHDVRVFDRFCFGEEPFAPIAASPACEVVKGDIRRLQEHPHLLDDIEAIIHLAGLANDPSCDLDPEMAVDVNLESTKELANQAVQKGVRRFVFASSCSVYGKGVFDVLDEESPTNPVSTYAMTRLEGERVLLPMRSDSFEPVMARPATLFGWSPRMRFDLAINQMTATAVRKNAITVMGGGNQWRPFIHVNDAARAFAAMAEAPADVVSGEIFNLGCDRHNFRIIDLAKQIAGLIDGTSLDVAKEDDDVRTYHVQFGKIHERLGFESEWGIERGVKEIREHLEQEDIDPFSDIYFNVRRMKTLLALPVDEGGEPVAPRFVPLAKPSLGAEEEEAVVEALRSGWLTSGPHVASFEEAFGDAVSASNVVAVVSCTAALHLCLVHLGVQPGDEVITSPITWPSTGNTILNMGAKPVFVDIDPDTLNMNPALLEGAITPRTKAIMPVHFAGQPCDMAAIRAVAAKHGVPIVEDAAHALGASYQGTPVGSGNDCACFSFYAIKNITTMEGGVVTLSDRETADHLRLLAANGMTATAWQRYGRSAAPAPTEVVEPGYKYLMGNVNAAMGVEQLKRLPEFLEARRRFARLYHAALAGIDELAPLDVRDDIDHAWHLFVIRLRLDRLNSTRDEIAGALRRENIGTGVHFYGLHLHQYYREALAMTPEMLPEATQASHEILSLPLHPGMDDRDVHHVVEALKKVVAHARRSR